MTTLQEICIDSHGSNDTLRRNVNRNVRTAFCIIEIAEVVSWVPELENNPWLYICQIHNKRNFLQINVQSTVCKQSLKVLLVAFVFDFQLADIFFDCLFVNVHRHYRSWISDHRCLQWGCCFIENIACTWIAVSRFAIASQFDISPFAFCETWLRT